MDSAAAPATHATRVAAELRHAILEGVLRPGERLRAEAIAERFGTSRTPVREAFHRLEVEGLVEVQPRRGAVVRAFDATDLLDLYELRAVLEPYAAARAATSISRPALDRLGELCDLAEARGGASEGAIDDQIAWNEEFHRLVIEGAASPRLTAAMRGAAGIPRGFRSIFWATEEQRSHSLFCHREIVRALAARRAELAEAAMRVHVYRGREFLAEVIRERSR